MGLSQSSSAQEAVRASLAGEAASAAKRQAASNLGYYNVKLGDLQLRAWANTDVEFNNNVNLSSQNEQSDLIVRPQVSGRFVYPITDKNALNLSLGIGYSYYQQSQTLNRYFITPGSEVSFDLFVGDCVINLHDRFSVSQDSYQNAATVGSGDVGTFDNSSGIGIIWDANDLIVSGGYDYQIRRSTTSGFNQQAANSHSIFGQAGIRPNDFSVIGIEAGTAFIERDSFSGGNQYNAGVFYRAQISSYISLQAGIGYSVFALDNSALTGGESEITGTYGNLGIQHRVNRILSYSFSVARDLQLGLFSTTLDLYHADWSANWNLIQDIGLGTHIGYEWGSESGGAGDKLSRWNLGINLGRSITKKLGARLAYDWLYRTSNQANRSYTQHRYTFGLNYTF